MKRSKFTLIISLILGLLAIAGSILSYYTINVLTNLIMEKGGPGFIKTGFMVLAIGSIACELILAFVFTIKAYLHPKALKQLIKRFSITFIVFSAIGFITIILSGVIKYCSMIKPYPFPGFHIIVLIYHVIILAFAILNITLFKKYVANDTETIKMNFKGALLYIALWLVLFVVFNRFGALILSPTYVTWSVAGRTIPFYLYLLMPMALVAQCIVYKFGAYKKHMALGLIISCGLTLMTLTFLITFLIQQSLDPSYMSAISMAMPIERASSKPIDSIFMILVGLALPTLIIVEQSRKIHKLAKGN